MALTKNNQRSANRVAVDVGATGTRPAPKGAVAVLAFCILVALWAASMMFKAGRVGYYLFYAYVEYYMGVLTLVALSITIMIGLVATDRLVLSIRQRVLLQSAHRTTGVIAVVSLFVHVWAKLVENHIRVIDIFIPFLQPGNNRMLVGFGTMSGLIMVLVMWTGMARARFIGRGQPWMWRSVHAISYLMWPIALVHGLSAGRAAKAWVNVSYVVCILFVLVGLAVRLSVSLNRKKDFSSTAISGVKPVGKLVPTISAVQKKRPSRRDQERVEDSAPPVAILNSWQPAASPVTAPPVMAPPMMAPPEPAPMAGGRRYEDEEPMAAPRQRRSAPEERFEDERPRARRRVDDEFAYEEEPRPRSRRYADDPAETGTRMRRSEMEDTRSFRPDFDEPAPRASRYADDEEPAPRSRRRAEEPRYDEPAYESRYDQAPPPRGSRHADRGEFDEVPRQRGGPRYDDSPRYDAPRRGREIEDAPRARRDRGVEDDRADSGRHNRTGFVDLVDPADDNYLEPDDTPTLVDMASRRARRSTQQEAVRGQAGRGARRSDRGRPGDDVADDAYWSQLRGEAN